MWCLTSDGGVRYLVVCGGRCSIGRKAGLDVVLEAPSVSREHAEVAVGPQSGCWLTDVSRYGTFVNGDKAPANAKHPLRWAALLMATDTVRCSPFLLFRPGTGMC
jgi:predicted component of type VI protein secretion system